MTDIRDNQLLRVGDQRVSDDASLNAIQEIIGAVRFGKIEVARFALGDHDIYLFSIKHPLGTVRDVSHEQHRTSIPRRRWTPSVLPGVEYSLIERIIDCACRQAKVSRAQLASKHRSKPIALARALIAYYAHLSKAATYAEVASMMNVRVNSLYIGARRYRKSSPRYFKRSVEQFLALDKGSTDEASRKGGETGNGANFHTASSDAEIGERIASALESQ